MNGARAHKVLAAVLMAAAMVAFTLLPLRVESAEGGAAWAGNDRCLDCHGRKGVFKNFLDGQRVSVFVNAAGYKSSVHGTLTCDTCHDDFVGDRHPDKKYRSRKNYSAKHARKCRACHTDADIKGVEVHRGLLEGEKKGNPPLCQDCHGAHDTMAVSGGGSFAPEQEYCMGCHSRALKATFSEGGAFEVTTDASELRGSAHRGLACSDCHFGFNEEEHPRRTFRNAREFSLSLSEVCKRCHFDKYARLSESIHYKLLSSGRTDVPNCTDCHGTHDVAPSGAGKLANARRCARCHEKEYDIYKNSVHGSALVGQGNPDVPVCIDCHSSHDIVDPLSTDYHEAIPTMCSGCHGDRRIMDRYGLSTDVVKTYLGDFHGVTLSFYRSESDGRGGPARLIAECTDCHGTHDITGDFGRNPSMVRKNLAEKCRTCHEGAGPEFPDAWLSHYRPSMSHAPLVFIVDVAYSVLMPMMILGLVLQVMLHVWRFFSSR